MSTKYLAAYALIVLSGDENPSDEKIAKLFVNMSIPFEMNEIKTMTRQIYNVTKSGRIYQQRNMPPIRKVSNFVGKDTKELIQAGYKKFANNSFNYQRVAQVFTPIAEVKELPPEGKDAWDIRIHIRMDQLKVLLVKGLESRNVMGTIFSYVGHSDEVIGLMQRISHKSRAYIWNADALQGYLVQQNVMKILQ